MITVSIPQANAVANVAGQSSLYICAEGSASNGAGDPPAEVQAWVYPNPPPSPIPGSPPAGAPSATLTSNDWFFDQVPAPTCNGSAPFPGNTLVVWVNYTAGHSPWDENKPVAFQGQCADKTDCQP
jgi:hypothetical protein